MREFNTTGPCIPEKHYMVDLTERVREIKEMVDAGKYFTINRARQYGKTTTLYALANYLKDEYTVVSLDFQTIRASGFATEKVFVQTFSRVLLRKSRTLAIPEDIENTLRDYSTRK